MKLGHEVLSSLVKLEPMAWSKGLGSGLETAVVVVALAVLVVVEAPSEMVVVTSTVPSSSEAEDAVLVVVVLLDAVLPSVSRLAR